MTKDKDTTQLSRTRTPAKGKPKQPQPKKRKKWSWRKTFWLMFFTAAFAIFCAVGGYLFILLNGERLMQDYKDADMFQLAEVSTVYDINGNELAKLGKGIEHREIAEAREIPEELRNAFIATEDRRFKDHQGVDLWSIGRAMVKDVVARRLVEGGSTITQQLAKNMFLTSDKTFFRKATEVSIALALENHFTKEEILTMYLNRIYFGKGAYGVKAAAIKYFDKEDLTQLEVWEMATLAGIPKAPSHYNPIDNPERSKERRQVVLKLMYEQGYITEQEMKDASEVDYAPKESKDGTQTDQNGTDAYQSFLDYVVKEAVEKTGLTEDELNRGGYHIYTTMDASAQRIMFNAFNNDELFEKSKDDIKVQGAMVITDHKNGAIMAMMGGRDYITKGLNRATVQRQPGSSFKPIVSYAPAMETGEWFPWSKLNNEKQCFGSYCPSNLGGYSSTIEMKEAVKRSVNIPTVWLLNEIGLKTGFDFAKNMGFPLTKDDYNLSIALGGMTHGVSPLNMAEAYNAFANGGNYYPAYSISKITDRKAHDFYVYHVPKPKRVMSEKTAYYMTDMLQEVVKNGTGKQARIDGRQVAGKTGTTQHSVPGYNGNGDRDAWFVGYTPEWTAAVWMGYDKTDRDHVLHESSRVPSRMFSEVMGKALKSKQSGSFNKPDKVEEKPEAVKAVSGLNASYSENTKTISLSWNAADGDNIVYHVYRKSSKDKEYSRVLSGLKVTNAEDIGVFPGESYTYYVTAESNNEESKKSNEVTVQIEEEEVEPPIDPIEPPIVDPNIPVDPNISGQPDNPDNNGTPDPGTDSGDQGGNPGGGDITIPGTVEPDPDEPIDPPPAGGQGADGGSGVQMDSQDKDNGRHNGWMKRDAGEEQGATP